MNPWRTLFTLLGTSLVAAAAAVLNEWLERDLDAKMKRTEDRPLPAGRISPDEALLGGAGMAGVGLTTLYFGVHAPAALLAAATLALYLFVYTPMKRWTSRTPLWGRFQERFPRSLDLVRVEAELSLKVGLSFPFCSYGRSLTLWRSLGDTGKIIEKPDFGCFLVRMKGEGSRA